MVYRVVSTKLTEDEHTSLLDECGRQGVSPSSFIKELIIGKLSEAGSQTAVKRIDNQQMTSPKVTSTEQNYSQMDPGIRALRIFARKCAEREKRSE